MKILSSTINADGNYELLVEYEQRRIARDTAIIPSRQLLVNQGNQEAKDLTDDEYLANAIERLRSGLEDPQPVDAAAAARAAALVGTVVAKP